MGSYSAFTGVGEHFKPGLGKSRGVVHLLDRIASSVSRHEDDEHLWFHCDLRYQYSVDGRSYEGNALAVGGSSGDEKGANEEHRMLELGSAVDL
jgi:hypothetical protein